jgi:hypothetical protein
MLSFPFRMRIACFKQVRHFCDQCTVLRNVALLQFVAVSSREDVLKFWQVQPTLHAFLHNECGL